MCSAETDEDNEPSSGQCPECGGDCYQLGQLGAVRWLRCRQCGLDVAEED